MEKRKVSKLSVRLGSVFTRTGRMYTHDKFELLNWPLWRWCAYLLEGSTS